MKFKKFLLLSVFCILLTTFVSATPDLNVVAPEAGETYSVGTTVTIDFNVFDQDNNRLTIDLNFSSSQTQGSGTVIVSDLNLTAAYCPDQNFSKEEFPSACSYSWDTTGVPAGCYTTSATGQYVTTACNYYILADMNGHTFAAPMGEIFEAGASYFTITKISDVNISLDNIALLVNNSTTLADLVMGGVRDQGGLMGLAIGLTVAMVILITLIFSIIAVIPKIVDKTKRIK